MQYLILQDYYFLKHGDVIDTHDSNQQIYLDLMVETGKAEIINDETEVKL